MARTIFFVLTEVLLLLCYQSTATRFLPMLVWDHLNPQLRCRCNWPVVPRMDLYDRLEFVCPTLKIAMNQLDGYSRPVTEMNENIYRRKWDGSEQELKERIENDSIQSFCDPSKSTTIHTCRNGEYTSKAVTFKYNRDKTRHYKVGEIYIFYNNADNGRESSLRNVNINCTMLFAVYVSNREKIEHDLTFGKKALSQKCKCDSTSSVPRTITPCSTPSSKVPNTTQGISTSSQHSTTTQFDPSIDIIDDTTTTSNEIATSSLQLQENPTDKRKNSNITSRQLGTSKYRRTTEQSTISTNIPGNPKEECQHPWLTMTLCIFGSITFVAIVIAVLMFLLWFNKRRQQEKQETFHSNSTHSTESRPSRIQRFYSREETEPAVLL